MKTTANQAREFTERCTACGACAAMCPAFSHRLTFLSDGQIQEEVRAFLQGGPATEAVIERSRLCNGCWKCVADACPQGLDPMRVNQLLRGVLHDLKADPRPFIPPSDPDSNERITAALLTTAAEYERITTPAIRGAGSLVFFPGCNVYCQPNLLLTALDVLEAIADDWTFLPGMDLCCGSNHDVAGRLTEGLDALDALARCLSESDAEALVTWCPTCAVRLRRRGLGLPVIPFVRFVADRLEDPLDGQALSGALTLHEACALNYTDLDPQAPRDLLQRVTDRPVMEMPRHGPDAPCCGWALLRHRPEAWKEEHRRRMTEAAATGADTLVTACHGCQEIMDRPETASLIPVVNFVTIVGQVLGIRHQDRCREWRHLEDAEAVLESIRKGMGDRFDRLPFRRQRIREAVGSVIKSR